MNQTLSDYVIEAYRLLTGWETAEEQVDMVVDYLMELTEQGIPKSEQGPILIGYIAYKTQPFMRIAR